MRVWQTLHTEGNVSVPYPVHSESWTCGHV